MGKSVLFLCGAILLLVIGMIADSQAFKATSILLNFMSLGENTLVTNWVDSKFEEFVEWLN